MTRCTANLYRDLWGFYREIGVQGSHTYRVSLGIEFLVIVFVFYIKNSQGMLVIFVIYRRIPVTPKYINKTLNSDNYMDL